MLFQVSVHEKTRTQEWQSHTIFHQMDGRLCNVILVVRRTTFTLFTFGPAVGIETCRWGKERRGGCENFLKLVYSFALWEAVVVTSRKREAAVLHFIWQELPSVYLNWNHKGVMCCQKQGREIGRWRLHVTQQKKYFLPRFLTTNSHIRAAAHDALQVNFFCFQALTFHWYFFQSVELLQWAETMLYCESDRHMKPLSGTPTVSVTAFFFDHNLKEGRGEVFSLPLPLLWKRSRRRKGEPYESHGNHCWLRQLSVTWLIFKIMVEMSQKGL